MGRHHDGVQKDHVSQFLSYQPSNRFTRRTMKVFDQSSYKISRFVKRKNPHSISGTNNENNNVQFLLQRREDGRSVHTPLHITNQRKRFSTKHAKRYGKKFNIIKVGHRNDDYDEEMKKNKRKADLLQIKKAQRRQFTRERESHPITHRHVKTGEDTSQHAIHQGRARKPFNNAAQDSSVLHLALQHSTPQESTLISHQRRHGHQHAHPPNSLFHQRRHRHQHQHEPAHPPNSLFYGWGAVSELAPPNRRKHAGPSLMQALSLSPRAYPERLSKNLKRRRFPDAEYQKERYKEIQQRKRQSNSPRAMQTRRTHANANANANVPIVASKHLLRELNKSVLLLPHLTSRCL